MTNWTKKIIKKTLKPMVNWQRQWRLTTPQCASVDKTRKQLENSFIGNIHNKYPTTIDFIYFLFLFMLYSICLWVQFTIKISQHINCCFRFPDRWLKCGSQLWDERTLSQATTLGPDNIWGRLLKSCTSQFSVAFSQSFTCSLKENTVPFAWKTSVV